MKTLSLITIGLGLVMNTAQAQTTTITTIDLEKLPYHTSGSSLPKIKNASAVSREEWTFLPGITTDYVKGFKFGTVGFTNGGEYGVDDVPYSKVSLVFNDEEHTQLIGMVLRVQKAAESKILKKYVSLKYGKGKVIITPPKPRATGEVYGYAVYSYSLKSNQTMLVVDNYTSKNDKSAYGMDIYIIDNDAKSPYISPERNVLKNLLSTMGQGTSIKQD